MNIFYISENPVEAAEWMVDRHVVKMILESAQLLSHDPTQHSASACQGPVITITLNSSSKRKCLPCHHLPCDRTVQHSYGAGLDMPWPRINGSSCKSHE